MKFSRSMSLVGMELVSKVSKTVSCLHDQRLVISIPKCIITSLVATKNQLAMHDFKLHPTAVQKASSNTLRINYNHFNYYIVSQLE
jgi:hypothetical protein